MAASAHFDIGNLDAAQKWLDRAQLWAKRVEADYVKHTLAVTQAMIALERGELESVPSLVNLEVAAASKSPVIIHRLYDMSLVARYALATGNTEVLRKCADPLMAAVWHVRAFRRQDYFVATAVFSTAALQSREEAIAWLASYRDAHRDTGSHPWRELVAAGYLPSA